jgi:hypothetical protein
VKYTALLEASLLEEAIAITRLKIALAKDVAERLPRLRARFLQVLEESERILCRLNSERDRLRGLKRGGDEGSPRDKDGFS